MAKGMFNLLILVCCVCDLATSGGIRLTDRGIFNGQNRNSNPCQLTDCKGHLEESGFSDIDAFAHKEQQSRGFFSWIAKGAEIVGQVIGVVHKTRSENNDREETESNFNRVFGNLDRNFQAITNVQEAIDLMMSKSLDAIGSLDQHFHESISQILNGINTVGQKVDRNFAYLLKVFQLASETYTAVEKTRYEMKEEFRRVLEYAKSSRIEPAITKLNNFVIYFSNEKARISQLPRDERIAALLENNGFLSYLRQSRTPKGDSLESFLFELIQEGYAVPENSNDTIAYAALSSLYYGVTTHISVMRYLTKVNIYLADDSYRNRDIVGFNHHMDNVVTDFRGFSDYLTGGMTSRGLIDQTIDLLRSVNNLGFMGNLGNNNSAQLSERAKSLEEEKRQLEVTSLPIVMDIPGKLMTHLKFDENSLNTPLGLWEDGAQVSYAVQYVSQDNLYSKVGEWSDPFTVKRKANPRLRIPAHSTYSRLIFRRFNNERPQYVGMIERGNSVDFRDIDRDLYNAASGSDEIQAIDEARLLLANGANISATFDQGRCAIHAAASNGNTNLAKKILLNTTGVDINAKDRNFYSPLHIAAEGGWDDFIELLIDHNADVNAKTKFGSTPLHFAISSGYGSAVLALLSSTGANLNAQDDDGAGPLHKSVLNGVEDIIQMLLEDRRTDVNLESKGNLSALHLSMMVNSPGATEKILRVLAARINARCEGNMTALHLAAISGNLPALQLLLDYNNNGDLNARSVNGWAPLHFAVAMKNDQVVTELLKHDRLIIDIFTSDMTTPLHIAAATDQVIVVKELLSHGAAVDLRNKDGRAAFHIAAINNNLNVMSFLMDNGVNINTRTTNGSTALHLATDQGNLRTVMYILERNPNLNIKNDWDDTALEIAERQGHGDIIKLLKQKISENNFNLVKAAMEGRLEDIKLLLQRGAYVDFRDTESGYTPLHIVVMKGYSVELAEYLIKKRADVNTRNRDGWTPLHEAANYGRLDLVKILIKNEATINVRSTERVTPLYRALNPLFNPVSNNPHADVAEYLKSVGGVL